MYVFKKNCMLNEYYYFITYILLAQFLIFKFNISIKLDTILDHFYIQ